MARVERLLDEQKPPKTRGIMIVATLVALVAASLNVSMSQGTKTLWIEDWEGDWIADWHVDAGTWEVGIPSGGPGAAHAGQNSAATVLSGAYPASADTRLIRHTSFVVPSASQHPRLRFWHWYSISSGDRGEVQIKVGTGNWQTISEAYTNTGSGVWTHPSIDLRAYADSTVQLAFRFVSDVNGSSVSTGWYVDDVAVVVGQTVFDNPETWETGLGDWYCDRGTWQVGEPGAGADSAFAGQYCAATVLNGNYHASVDSRLISPSFTVPGASQNPSLTLWHWYSFSSGDNGRLEIRTQSGQWTSVLGPYTNTGGGIWSPVYFDLSGYADSTVQIAFHFVSDVNGSSVSTGWYVDDIRVTPDVTSSAGFVKSDLPLEFHLSQNYPNPCNPSTSIQYALPVRAFVSLTVSNIVGQHVARLFTGEQEAGRHQVTFDASGLSSGIYLYTLRAGEFVQTRKLVLVR